MHQSKSMSGHRQFSSAHRRFQSPSKIILSSFLAVSTESEPWKAFRVSGWITQPSIRSYCNQLTADAILGSQSIWMGPLAAIDMRRSDELSPFSDGVWLSKGKREERLRHGEDQAGKVEAPCIQTVRPEGHPSSCLHYLYARHKMPLLREPASASSDSGESAETVHNEHKCDFVKLRRPTSKPCERICLHFCFRLCKSQGGNLPHLST